MDLAEKEPAMDGLALFVQHHWIAGLVVVGIFAVIGLLEMLFVRLELIRGKHPLFTHFYWATLAILAYVFVFMH